MEYEEAKKKWAGVKDLRELNEFEYEELLEVYANRIAQLEAAQHRIHLTAFSAFCGGTIFGMFVMLVMSAFLSGGR